MYSLPLSWKRISRKRAGSLFFSAFIVAGGFATPAVGKEPPRVLDIVKVTQLLLDQGYYDIREIELSDDHKEYEVKARNPKGNMVEVELDASSGEILDVEND